MSQRAPTPPCPPAADIAANCFLTEPARRLLRDGLPADAFLGLLRERGLLPDALRFLALALPRRVAVWWGCQCAWHLKGAEEPAPSLAALRAAVRWVLDPSEDNRRAAEGPGQEAGLEDPAGCLAMSAFWSGGSMTPPHLPAVKPPPFLTGRLVGGAVLLASVRHQPLRCLHHYRTCLALGIEAAEGKNLWFAPAPEPAAPAPAVAPPGAAPADYPPGQECGQGRPV